MLRWFGWIKIHLQWLNWFKTSYGQASCFHVSQELHSSRALPTMPLSKCTNPATLSSVVKGWYQVRNIHRMPWCWFPLKKIYCTCDKDKTLHYHTWDQQQKNDCQTISIKKTRLENVWNYIQQTSGSFSTWHEMPSWGSIPSQFPRLMFVTQKKSQINIPKNLGFEITFKILPKQKYFKNEWLKQI